MSGNSFNSVAFHVIAVRSLYYLRDYDQAPRCRVEHDCRYILNIFCGIDAPSEETSVVSARKYGTLLRLIYS